MENDQFSPLQLYNEMNSINTKLSFTANKQDYSPVIQN